MEEIRFTDHLERKRIFADIDEVFADLDMAVAEGKIEEADAERLTEMYGEADSGLLEGLVNGGPFVIADFTRQDTERTWALNDDGNVINRQTDRN